MHTCENQFNASKQLSLGLLFALPEFPTIRICWDCLAEWIAILIVLAIIWAFLRKNALIRGIEEIILELLKLMGKLLSAIFKGLIHLSKALLELLAMLIRGLFALLAWIFGLGGGRHRRRGKYRSGSRFANAWERFRVLSSFYGGFLIVDGNRALRLSLKQSFKHVVVVGRSGSGKSSLLIRYAWTKPVKNCSLVGTDPDGSHYAASAGYLQQELDYDIIVLNLLDPTKSNGYNPMLRLKNFKDINAFSNLLIDSSYGNNVKDPFWTKSAVSILNVIIYYLVNQPEKKFCNLANVKMIAEAFDTYKKPMAEFLIHFGDQSMYSQYLGFVSNDERVKASILATVRGALVLFGDKDIARLTSVTEDEFPIEELRKRKIAIYVIVGESQTSYYNFLLRIFYTQVFDFLLTDRKKDEKVNVAALIEEAGNMGALTDSMDMLMTSIRRKKTMIMLVFQSLTQAEKAYGNQAAKIIFEGSVGTKIILSGTDGDQAQQISHQLGNTTREVRDGKHTHTETHPLVSAEDLRTMKEKFALMICDNTPAMILRLRSFYRFFANKSNSKIQPKTQTKGLPELHYLPQNTDKKTGDGEDWEEMFDNLDNDTEIPEKEAPGDPKPPEPSDEHPEFDFSI